MPNLVTKPVQLPEELGMYVDALRKRHPSLDEVWVIDHDETRGGHWSLLAFGDDDALRRIRADESAHRDDLDFMIVIDGDRFESAWGARRAGRLCEIGWALEDPQSATYRPAGAADPKKAVRVR